MTKRRFSIPFPRRAPLAAALAMCLAASSPAATITVDGNTVEGPGKCTLVDAVRAIDAGATSSGNICSQRVTGTFGSDDTILLHNYVYSFRNDDQNASEGKPMDASSALVMTKPMTLRGALGQNNEPMAVIQRDSTSPFGHVDPNFRVIKTTADLTLIGVSVQFGVADNANGDGGGGGIKIGNVGTSPVTLKLVNSVVSGNSAIDSSGPGLPTMGGGIYANGANVVLVNSRVASGYYMAGNTADQGGGIFAINGDVTVHSSTISGNTATLAGGGIHAENSYVGIYASTLDGNTASNGYGGGIELSGSQGAVKVVNSTISGNHASDGGGGIDATSVDLYFSTFVGNTTPAGHSGGGIRIAQYSYAYATLMTGNDPGNDVDGAGSGLTLGGGYNSIKTIGQFVTISGNHNKLELDACSAPADLANNGGPTQTMALVPGANDCAIDAGPISTQGWHSDQRGVLFERRAGAATDIGAFELQPNNDRIFYDDFEP